MIYAAQDEHDASLAISLISAMTGDREANPAESGTGIFSSSIGRNSSAHGLRAQTHGFGIYSFQVCSPVDLLTG